ncbi:MAG: hybrid sensor histidine kinase/response regulator [Verrucomicrobia bacterium]|nr:hybrid sensor histidine kinase/response regulator [Verrucomicrobiota bacterium]
MLELFRVETETQTAVLTSGLLELEKVSRARGEESGHLTPDPSPLALLLEALMRAAHSLKGGARIVNLPVAVRVAHAMEDCFVAAQHGKIQLGQPVIDVLFRGVDLFSHISKHDEANIAAWETDHAAEIQEVLTLLGSFMPTHKAGPPTGSEKENGGGPPSPVPSSILHPSSSPPTGALTAPEPKTEAPERVLRLTADNLNRLLGLAGESLVESRWLRPFTDSMQRLKRMQTELEQTLDGLRQGLQSTNLSERSTGHFNALFAKTTESRQFLADRLQELDLYDRRSAHLSNRLYLEVLRTRMRPFADGTHRFPRMVRDLARSLGKQARLEIIGENTQVDRDILDRLETPLAHLLRNAVDHGCETPEQRQRAGKPAEAVIQLEARHSAGMLLVVVSDDGAGADPNRLRQIIVEKKLTTMALAEKMHEAELLEFLFLPGFTLKNTVTEISGRGVGLDVVQNMVKSVRGNVRVFTQPGRGMKFQLQLPLTLSVLRTLLVEIGGEPYAIPLAQIAHTLKLPRDKIEALEGRHFFRLASRVEGRESDQPATLVALLTAHEVIDCAPPKAADNGLSIVVLGDRSSVVWPSPPSTPLTPNQMGERERFGGGRGRNQLYGLVVDRFLGERELVVQPLDPRLGKVKDISAAALMEDGAPVLIVDVDDLLRSIEKLIASGTLANVRHAGLEAPTKKRKRVLVVDDSLTVRELERKLLLSRGYLADVAVDGMEAWSMLKAEGQRLKEERTDPSAFSLQPSALPYDLVITDVDMPRMDGIELATLIKKDARLKSLPVMIVSYKDREEDRLRGLDAGADYYLTKGSFHDERLLEAVMDLIGEPES